MKKCLYIDHIYHEKTRSTDFLRELLEKEYELTYCFLERHKEESIPWIEKYKDVQFDLLICFQLLPSRQAISSLKFKNGVIVPMYDGMLPLTDKLWCQYKDFKILNFSKSLHKEFLRSGFDSKYIQYYPKPLVNNIQGDVRSAFFWQRTEALTGKDVLNLLVGTSVEHLHIHTAKDPGQDVPSSFTSNKISISSSSWFQKKQELYDVLQQSAIYFAPRPSEGIGQSFLDAMAMGRCVVAVDSPTANEYITHGVNGVLYRLGDKGLEGLNNIVKMQKNALESIRRGRRIWDQEKLTLYSWLNKAVQIKPTVVFDSTILLNLHIPGASRTGIFFVALNVVKELAQRSDVRLVFFIDSANESQLNQVLRDIFPNEKQFTIYTELSDFVGCTAFLSPVFKFPTRIRNDPLIQKCIILHDCIPIVFGGEYGSRQQWWFEMFNSLQPEDCCFAVSSHTKSDFLKYKPSLDPDNLVVIPLGVSDKFTYINDISAIKKIKQKYGIKTNNYVLSICSLEPRKNVMQVAKAFLEFIRRDSLTDLSFVMVGQKWDNFNFKITDFNLSESEKDKFVFTGYVPDEDLAYIYSGATMFVYASLYEGFGLPVIEAMACGTPVISSNTTSLEEVSGDAAILVDPNSVSEIVDAISSYYYFPNLRNKKRELGFRNIENYQWSECVDKIVKTIHEKEQLNFPKITVVTVTFNLLKAGRKDSFLRCVDSVLHQVYPGKVEHIVVDGNSSDGTELLLEELFKAGKITKFISEPDTGVYDAMNKGIALAQGDYIGFLNSDDYYHDKQGLFQVVRALLKTKADYAYGDAVVENVFTGEQQVWVGSLDNLPFASHYCHQTMFVKSSVLRDLHGFDLDFKVSSDSDLCIRIEKDGYKSVHVAYPFVTYFIGEGISSVNQNQSKLDHSKSFYKHFGSDLNLCEKDCLALWQAKGITGLSREDQLRIGASLGRPAWIKKYFNLLVPLYSVNSSDSHGSYIRHILVSKKEIIRKYARRYLPKKIFEKGRVLYFRLIK